MPSITYGSISQSRDQNGGETHIAGLGSRKRKEKHEIIAFREERSGEEL